MSSSSIVKMASLLGGLATGSVFGIYISQNYVVPDVSQLVSLVQNKANEYTKDSNDSSSTESNKKDS